MVAIYVRLVRSGSMTLEQVPALWRAQVEAAVPPANSDGAAALDVAPAHGAGAGHRPEEAREEAREEA